MKDEDVKVRVARLRLWARWGALADRFGGWVVLGLLVPPALLALPALLVILALVWVSDVVGLWNAEAARLQAQLDDDVLERIEREQMEGRVD